MRILCKKCGGSEVVQLSPDYDPKMHREFLGDMVRIRFLYDGDPVDEYLLSSEFAESYQLQDSDIKLPDEYPVWIERVGIQCRMCFDSRIIE